jgi:hypothetical protein
MEPILDGQLHTLCKKMDDRAKDGKAFDLKVCEDRRDLSKKLSGSLITFSHTFRSVYLMAWVKWLLPDPLDPSKVRIRKR